MRIVFLIICCLVSDSFAAENKPETITILFSGNKFEIPDGVKLIASDTKESEKLLILKYSNEKKKQYIGLWDETDHIIYSELNCEVRSFFNSVFLKEKSECNPSVLSVFYKEFVLGFQSGVLLDSGIEYYYSEGRGNVNVFFISKSNKIIHMDSDFLSKEKIVKLSKGSFRE